MVQFIQANRKKLAERVRTLRTELGLSQHDLSVATGLSNGTITHIESGTHDYGIDKLLAICFFFRLSLAEFCDFDRPSSSLVNSGNPLTSLPHKKPTILYALTKKVLRSDFLATGKVVGEIKKFILEHYGWDYRNTSISNTLKSLEGQGLILSDPHPIKQNAKLYRKATGI